MHPDVERLFIVKEEIFDNDCFFVYRCNTFENIKAIRISLKVAVVLVGGCICLSHWADRRRKRTVSRRAKPMLRWNKRRIFILFCWEIKENVTKVLSPPPMQVYTTSTITGMLGRAWEFEALPLDCRCQPGVRCAGLTTRPLSELLEAAASTPPPHSGDATRRQRLAPPPTSILTFSCEIVALLHVIIKHESLPWPFEVCSCIKYITNFNPF